MRKTERKLCVITFVMKKSLFKKKREQQREKKGKFNDLDAKEKEQFEKKDNKRKQDKRVNNDEKEQLKKYKKKRMEFYAWQPWGW